MITFIHPKRTPKLARTVLLVVLCALAAVAVIQLVALATHAPLPEGWMLSTGPLP